LVTNGQESIERGEKRRKQFDKKKTIRKAANGYSKARSRRYSQNRSGVFGSI
jgi:hypothetical protein